MMRRMFTTGLASCALIAAAPARAEAPSDYAAALAIAPQGTEALQRVELPVAVYANAQHADLADLRVFNAANELVPYALVGDATPAPHAPETFSPPVFPVWSVPGKRIDELDVRIEQRADGTVASIRTVNVPAPKANAERHAINYIIDASKIELPIAVMRPQWTGVPDNYVGTARVEASDDLKGWRTLVAGATLVYLAQGQARLQSDRIQFPPTRAKYYRVTFGPNAPFLIDMQMDAPALRPERRRQSVRVSGQPGAKPGEIDYDLNVRAPIDRLRIDVRQTNALAPVRIESRPDASAEWRPIATTIAYRLVRDGKEISSPEIPVATNASPRWKLVVDPASGGLGNPPPELEASWPVRNLVFVARGAGPFTLAVGRKDAKAASLPIASLMPGYREDAETLLPAATVGDARIAPPPAPPMLTALIGEHEPQKIALWAALAAGVALLAVMAWRLSRQMNAKKE
jgi:hypothetical protein